MIEVYTSNRLEALVDALAETVAEPLPSPIEPETIVVQSRGMETWLSMRLAERFGIWANAAYPFPRTLIHRVLAAAHGARFAETSAFEPRRAAWLINHQLEVLGDQPALAPLVDYLGDDPLGTKRFQLAQRIASTFDQYLVYRPDLIIQWEAGGGEGWQPMIWRALPTEPETLHVASAYAELPAKVTAGALAGGDLPSRVAVFGVSSLPPMYLGVLEAMSQHVPVRLFHLNPSQRYWAHIRSRREIGRAAGGSGADADALHLEEGNPLLASLGRLGRDFQYTLGQLGAYAEPGPDLFGQTAADTMLTTLQQDILDLLHRRPDSSPGPAAIAPDDRSISVHACHSPMREVEVLSDQIRAMLDEDPDLAPRDIVVMMPDVAAYAPYIEAVFGAGPTRRPAIPFAITDRTLLDAAPAIDAFLGVLALTRGRFGATEVMDLLMLEPVRTRFGLSASQVEQLRVWVANAMIRWGIDTEHRVEQGQPPFFENTWRFGLDRMLVGYALRSDGTELFEGTLPYDEIEGGDAILLGKLAALADLLFEAVRDLKAPRSAAQWRETLASLLTQTIAADGIFAAQYQRIREAIEALAHDAGDAGADDLIDIEVIRYALADGFRETLTSTGFLGGGVTFCAMVPMRSIPFEVVCLIGMDDAAFPRRARPVGFDLIAAHPRPGDRSRRNEDRYLFLEALISARKRVLISYCGQSIKDNSDVPPSVVVSELIDVVAEGFALDGERGADIDAQHAAIEQRLVLRHPLQPFSPRYFVEGGDQRLFSYAAGYCAGAAALLGGGSEAEPFLTQPLTPPTPEDSRLVSLDDLAAFFKSPAQFILRRRLGIYLGEADEPTDDREPVTLTGLEQYGVGAGVLSRGLASPAPEDAAAIVRASGELPAGTPGDCAYEDVAAEVASLAADIREFTAQPRLPPIAVDVDLGGTQLVGWLGAVYPPAQLDWGFRRVRAKHEAQLWIRHLALCATLPDHTGTTIALGRGGKGTPARVRLRRVADPQALLADLVALYHHGQSVPLPFFPSASMKLVESEAAGSRDPLGAAHKVFWSARPPGEHHDASVLRLYGERDPLDREFSQFGGPADPDHDFPAVARRVFEAYWRHREAEV